MCNLTVVRLRNYSDSVLVRGFEFSRPIHSLLNGEPEHDRTIFGHR